jgi:uncharacterized protein
MDAEPYVRPRRHRLQPISAVFLLLVGTHAVASSAAGFDCAKAALPVEHAICASPELSARDADLAAAYAVALGVVKDPPKLRTQQRAWLSKRDGCLKSTPVCEGAVQIYQDGIVQLQALTISSGVAHSAPPQTAKEACALRQDIVGNFFMGSFCDPGNIKLRGWYRPELK